MFPVPNSAPDSLTPSHSRAPELDALAALEEELATAEVVAAVVAAVDEGLGVATLDDDTSFVAAKLAAIDVEAEVATRLVEDELVAMLVEAELAESVVEVELAEEIMEADLVARVVETERLLGDNRREAEVEVAINLVSIHE